MENPVFKRLCISASALLATALPALAQDVKVEKFALDNGMTVILREDHTLPVATINLWYRVGAKEEPPRRSGFAHLFEHLMFMGTQRVPGNDFDKLMEGGGGSNNASTSLDRTNYFSTGPSDLLPTLLWLDADRLEDLGRTMNQEKLDKQRDVVLNERKQTVENAPYGKADDAIYRLMYPQGHPYHFSVIGTNDDLAAAQVTDVKDFFATFYVPSNCSLVVAGDFNPAEIKPLVTKLFGTLPPGGKVINRTLKDWPVPVLGKVIRQTMLDKVEQPRITFCYHSAPWYAEGDAELDLLSAVLTQGKSSRLYKRLVLDEKLAIEVSARQESAVLGSLYHIDVITAPEADLNRVEAIVDEELNRLMSAGITSDELEQRKNTIELGFLSRMDSLGSVADKLNEYQYIWGEPNSFKRDLDRFRNPTPAAVVDVAKKFLTSDSRVIMRVLPEEPSRADSPRDKAPDKSAEKPFSPAAPQSFVLSGGTKVLLWQRQDLPLVALRLLISPGGALAAPNQAGVAYLTADMMGEGAGGLDAVQFADSIQKLGAIFGAYADQETLSVDLTVLKRNFPAAASLFADAIRKPRFTETDWERVHRLHLEDLESQLSEPTIVAGRVATRKLFGEDHPYAMPVPGTPTTVKAITLDQIKAFHASLLTPASATLLIAGDLTPDQAKGILEPLFAGWTTGTSKFNPVTAGPVPAPSNPGLRFFLVERPEAVQTVVRFGTTGPKLSDSNRINFRLLNTVLGGSFTSRLNQNLREDHGYTYGAGSTFNMEPSTGYWIARSSVKASNTGAALKEFFKEFDRLRGGDLTDADVSKAVKTIRTDTIQSLSGLRGPLLQVSDLLAAGMTLESIGADLEAATKVTAKELNALAKGAFPLENGVLVLVGDKNLIMEQIKDLGLPKPVILSADGTSGLPLNPRAAQD